MVSIYISWGRRGKEKGAGSRRQAVHSAHPEMRASPHGGCHGGIKDSPLSTVVLVGGGALGCACCGPAVLLALGPVPLPSSVPVVLLPWLAGPLLLASCVSALSRRSSLLTKGGTAASTITAAACMSASPHIVLYRCSLMLSGTCGLPSSACRASCLALVVFAVALRLISSRSMSLNKTSSSEDGSRLTILVMIE